MNRHLRRRRPLLIGSGARLAAALVGLAGTTWAARSLGPAAWGDWVVLFAMFGWAQHLAEWGLRNVALVEAGRLGEAPPSLIVDLWFARLPMLLLAGTLLFTSIWIGWPHALPAAVWFMAALLAIALNLDWASLARGDPLPAAMALLARPLAFLVTVLLLPSPLGVTDLAFATFAAWTGAALAGCWRRRWRSRVDVERRRLGRIELLRSGVPFLLVTAANQLAPTADLAAVAWMLGPAQAGLFGLIATIAQTATFGAQASAQWWLARAVTTPAGEIRRALAEAAVLGALAGGALALFGPPMIRLAFGPSWSEAADLLPLAGLHVAAVHLTAVLAAWTSAAGGAASVATVQLATQALLWPLQLLAAVAWGLPGVLLLRGIAEAVRGLWLLAVWRQHRAFRAVPLKTA